MTSALRFAWVFGVLALGCASPVRSGIDPQAVIYESGATDEAWVTIDETPATKDATRAPQLTAPTFPIARDVAPTFAWTGGQVASAPIRENRAFAELHQFLVPVAHAHLPPVTGAMYRLDLDFADATPDVHVLTGATTYTPAGDVWTRLSQTQRAVTLSLSGSYLRAGRIEEGPFAIPEPVAIVFR